MRTSDRRKFAEIITGMAEVFGRDLSPIAIKVYWEALKELDLDEFVLRANQLTKAGKFLPRPADFLEFGAKSLEDAALLAWDLVSQTLERVGTYRTVAFSDPVIHLVVEALGVWVELGQAPENDPWIRKRFLEEYLAHSRSLKHRGIVECKPQPRLVGRLEIDSGVSQEPTLIGDEVKAQAWIDQVADVSETAIDVTKLIEDSNLVQKALKKAQDAKNQP